MSCMASGTSSLCCPSPPLTPAQPLVLTSSAEDRVSLSKRTVKAQTDLCGQACQGQTGKWLPPSLPSQMPPVAEEQCFHPRRSRRALSLTNSEMSAGATNMTRASFPGGATGLRSATLESRVWASVRGPEYTGPFYTSL